MRMRISEADYLAQFERGETTLDYLVQSAKAGERAAARAALMIMARNVLTGRLTPADQFFIAAILARLAKSKQVFEAFGRHQRQNAVDYRERLFESLLYLELYDQGYRDSQSSRGKKKRNICEEVALRFGAVNEKEVQALAAKFKKRRQRQRPRSSSLGVAQKQPLSALWDELRDNSKNLSPA